MDSQALLMLHIFMLFHMRRMKMNQTAEIFAREAGINNIASGFNVPAGFLGDWWCIFWDYFNSRYKPSNVVQPLAESSLQAEARVHAQAQFQAQPDAQSYFEFQTQAQSQAQSQAQTQEWYLGNNEMAFYNPYTTIGQPSTQPFSFYGYNANMSTMSEPVFAPGSNNYVQQGLVSSDPSVQNHTTTTTPVTQPARRKASGPRNRTKRGSSSNAASQRAARTNPVTGRPPSSDVIDLNAFLEDINNMR